MSTTARETTPATITTSGVGEIRLKADRSEVQVIVERHAAGAAAASAESGRAATEVRGALLGLGLADADVRISGFTVAPNYSYQPEKHLVDYVARTTLEIEVRDFARFGAILDAALGAGATEVSEPSWHSASRDQHMGSAVQLAFGLARDEASAIASAAGGRLGRLLSVTSGQPRHDVLHQAKADRMMMTAGGGAPSPERDVVVVATVTAQWVFEPGEP